MPSRPTDIEDEMAQRGMIKCNVPLPDPACNKITIDPLWLLDFLHKNAKDLESIEVRFNEQSVVLINHDKKLKTFTTK